MSTFQTRKFYGKSQPERNLWIVPETAADSDLELDDDTIEETVDDDILDPDFILELADDDELTPTSLGLYIQSSISLRDSMYIIIFYLQYSSFDRVSH